MMIMTEVNLQKSQEEKQSLAAELHQMTMAHIAEQVKLAEEIQPKEDDPAEAVVKAYAAMDKEMMKVMDEHIERVRRSNEKNKELYRQLAMKKEIEKRDRTRKENFDEAADKAEEQRDFLRMKG